MSARNLIRNPSAEGDLLSLIGGASGTSTVSIVNDAQTGRGTRSYRIAATTAATAHARSNDYVAATAGQKWWARCAARLDPTAYGPRRLYAELRFHGADGSTIGSSVGAALDLVPDGTYRRWQGAANASPSEEYAGTTRRVNYATNPHGVTGGGAPVWTPSGYGTGGAGSVTSVAAGAPDGGAYSQQVWSTAATGGGASLLHPTFTVPAASVDRQVAASVYVMSNQATAFSMPATVGATSTTGGDVSGIPIGSWVKLTRMLTVPASSTPTSIQTGVRISSLSGTTAGLVLAGTMLLVEDSATFGSYFDGSSRTPIQGLYRYWSGTANSSASVEARPDGTARTNRVPNPGFATGIAGWLVPAGTWDSVNQRASGSASAQINTGNVAGQTIYPASTGERRRLGVMFTNAGANALAVSIQAQARSASATLAYYDNPQVTVQPGTSAWLSMVMPTGGFFQGTTQCALVVRVGDGGWPTGSSWQIDNAIDTELGDGTPLQASDYFDAGMADPALILPTGIATAPQQVTASGVAPAGTATVRMSVGRDAALFPSSSDVWYADDLMLVQSTLDTAPDYGDGSLPGWYWGGQPNASPSFYGGVPLVGDSSRPLTLQWIGTNGSVWDLLGGPVRASVAGIKGLGMPDTDDHVSTSAGRDGQRFRSLKRKARQVFVPVRFKDAAATDVDGIQAEWWRANRLGKYGRFVLTKPNGTTRTLYARFSDDGGYALKRNPYTVFDGTLGLTFVADDPYWYGEPIQVSYRLDPSGNVNFFGGGDPAAVNSGPPFVLSPAAGSQVYEIGNPGDVPAWPVWRITGPATAFSVGVAGSPTAAQQTIAASQTLEIRTDPLEQTATLGNARLPFQVFTAVNFAAIPEGESRQLAIQITGSGTVSATITPRYERAL